MPGSHKVRFKVSLDSGETLTEGEGELLIEEGKVSPWQKLKGKLSSENKKIVSLALRTPDDSEFSLLALNNTNPNFHDLTTAPKPKSYNYKHVMGKDVNQDKEDWFTVAEAQYDTYKLQIWIDENNPGKYWVVTV